MRRGIKRCFWCETKRCFWCGIKVHTEETCLERPMGFGRAKDYEKPVPKRTRRLRARVGKVLA